MNEEWQEIRQQVLERDHFSCVICGRHEGLQVDHKKPRDAGGSDDLNNLRTLCNIHHAAKHTYLQAGLLRRTIERMAHAVARWVDVDKVLPPEPINFGPLLRIFHKQNFLPGQLEVILAALRGESILYISPTGSGKSLCFQLPALYRDGHEMVFSPLKALMVDQVAKLTDIGLPATYINGDISKKEKEARLVWLENKNVKYLYLAPEQFGPMADMKKVLRLKNIHPSFVVLDEAHVVPKWQNSFRPDYSRINSLRNELGNPPLLAFTATAGPKILRKITNEMGQQGVRVFIRPVDRPNIYLETAVEDDTQRRLSMILNLWRSAKAAKGKVMIFVPTKKVGGLVRELFLANGYDVPFFHAALEKKMKDSIQSRFLDRHEPSLDIVICTNAFGMGLDIPNIRCVVHWQYPFSLEDYVQEYGRAGRDGLEAHALMFLKEPTKTGKNSDDGLLRFMIDNNRKTSRLDQETKRADHEFQLEQLDQIRTYATSNAICLRRQIATYFHIEEPKEKFNLTKVILNFVFTAKNTRPNKIKCCSFCDPDYSVYNTTDFALPTAVADPIVQTKELEPSKPIEDKKTPRQKIPRNKVEYGTEVLETMGRDIAVLGNRQKQIMSMRLGLDDGRQHTLEDIGKVFGLTRERIRQLELSALEKISETSPIHTILHPTRQPRKPHYEPNTSSVVGAIKIESHDNPITLDSWREHYSQAWKRWDTATENSVLAMFTNKATIREISEHLGRQPNAVRIRLKRLGITETIEFYNALGLADQNVFKQEIDSLLPEEKQILNMRIGLGYNSPLSIKDIAEKLGKSEDMISEIEEQALNAVVRALTKNEMHSAHGSNEKL